MTGMQYRLDVATDAGAKAFADYTQRFENLPAALGRLHAKIDAEHRAVAERRAAHNRAHPPFHPVKRELLRTGVLSFLDPRELAPHLATDSDEPQGE